MFKFLSFGHKKQRQVSVDAERLYQKLMEQSRKPVFYTPKLFADNYDGRMEVLCLHLSLVLYHLRRFGENGERLSQALYDVMIADFDVALREEGLSDTGVARRIKPLAKMFFSRAKTYADILESTEGKQGELHDILKKYVSLSNIKTEVSGKYDVVKLGKYTRAFSGVLANLSLGDIAKVDFSFPNL